jgi:hypothetical protein
MFTKFPYGPLLAFFAVGKTARTWEYGRTEMKTRTAGRVRIGIAALAFALAFLACGAAMASDVERQIPVIRDTVGSGLTTEITREGTRQTATPFLTLYNPSVQRIENRIVEKTAPWAAKEIPSGTLREDSGRSETAIASPPPVPGEITVRNVAGFLKGLRASRKEKPAPAVVVPTPELRLGRTDTSSSPLEAN